MSARSPNNTKVVLLTIERVPADYREGDNAPLQAALRDVVSDLLVLSVYLAPPGIRVLVHSEETPAEQVADAFRHKKVNRYHVSSLRLVELDEWQQDIQFIQQILQRDENALRAVIARFGGQICNSLKKRFNPTLSEQDLEECFNQAAWKLWRFANKFDPGKASLGTWFYKIAERKVLDHLRSDSSDAVRLEVDPPGEARRKSTDSTSQRGNGGLLQDLYAVIEKLPRLQKAIILADLEAGERANDEELAKALNTTINSIRVSRNKARKRIYKEMTARNHDIDLTQGADE